MKYFLIAGEASGDLHASNLMQELKKADAAAEFCFLGGDLMQAQGGQMVKNYREMAYMGFVAVIKNLGKVLRNLSDAEKAISIFQPDVVILIDYPSFNLRIAKFVKKNLPQIPVYYYISPKIWAWKEYRITSIKRYVDKMYTIFPFETSFYAKHNYEVEYVGNPSVDSVTTGLKQIQPRDVFFTQHQLSEKPIIALLAGSRKQEISSCLPRMFEAANSFADHQIVIAGAPGIDASFYQPFIQHKNANIVFGQTYDLLQYADVAVVNSGTATLETALIGTPQVVVYHTFGGRLTYWLKNHIIKVKYVSLVNLIAEKEAVKELIIHLFTVENVRNELQRLLYDTPYRQTMINEYNKIRKTMGNSGTAERAAEKIVASLRK